MKVDSSIYPLWSRSSQLIDLKDPSIHQRSLRVCWYHPGTSQLHLCCQ